MYYLCRISDPVVEKRMCAMLNIWDDCSSDDEEKRMKMNSSSLPFKSLADQEEQWYYSSEEEVNEVGVQSLTRSGRVYNPESSLQTKGKEVAVDGTKKRMTEKGGEEPKEKKKEEEVVKGQKKTVEIGESSQSKTPNGMTASSVLIGARAKGQGAHPTVGSSRRRRRRGGEEGIEAGGREDKRYPGGRRRGCECR
ncbi:hypothetical protein JCGZ_07899 [Jatropha curcas]|uniref:Uncharacterized protein n=1 Tax=Jatropha curcas TaxID=180498 RepID=A0A067KKB3_JATCU|nr:hypothetical protein JCGZ_07899 [Jatropha curcas]